MKTIMFAGADSMTDIKASQKAIQIPEVYQTLKRHGLIQNLEDSIRNMTSNPFPAMMASVLTQVALFKNYVRYNPGLYILSGCSLGDLAKLVSAQVIEVDVVAEGLRLFCEGLKQVPAGAIVQVKTHGPRTAEFYESLQKHNLYLAVDQTQQHCLVSGENKNLEAWKNSSQINFKPLFPFPLHSPLMEIPFQNLENILFSSEMHQPTMPLVSSTQIEFLSDASQIRQDLKQNILGEVKWQKTYSWLANNVKIRDFVNVGPISTLMLFGERIMTDAKVNLLDSLEPIKSEELCLA